MKKLILAFSCLLLMVLFFAACKKNHHGGPEYGLAGNWHEIGSTSGQSLSLTFSVGYTFGSSAIAGATALKYSGTYSLKGNALSVTATEMSVQEPGKTMQTTVVDHELFPEATYHISNDTLTLTYQTYKAVWPKVPTTIKFRKVTTVN
jgi:hypothetical protein